MNKKHKRFDDEYEDDFDDFGKGKKKESQRSRFHREQKRHGSDHQEYAQ
ncbi:hypothetical protein [Alteromonas facilis]|nr:hypothetical protein [Alteromonas facilis]